MAKAAEEVSDGLEIISIGKLYSGQWEKKYWSCSRGKDRYPYPVGFKAIRTHNGITYRMEIFEGLKGPLFTISSTDGLSSSGQTPDIAWDSFQKKGSSQIKLLRGKRFSCKIDGLEFFGFKNAFVQRLLRQLVANLDGPAEQGYNQSAIVNEALRVDDQVQQIDLNIPSNLLPYKEKPRVTLHRSKKEKLSSVNLESLTNLKKVHSQHGDHNALTSKNGLSCQEIQSNCDLTIPSSVKDDDFIRCTGAGEKSENLKPEIEKKLLHSSRNDSQLDLYGASHDIKLDSISAQEESKLAGGGGSLALEGNATSTKRKEPFVCSVTKIEYEEVKEKSKIEATHDSELCAPDTFDDQEGKVIVTDMAISNVLLTETHPEDDVNASNSYPSSEKPDSDSADQDITKSMMTLLLPQAIPLLKTFSRRKKKNKKSMESPTCISIKENNMINESPGRGTKETMELNQSNKQPDLRDVSYENMENLELVLLDNAYNDENNNHSEKKLPLFHDVQLADQLLMVPDTYQSEDILDMQSHAPDFPIEATHDGSSFPADSCIGNSATYVMRELPDDENLADFDMSTLPAQIHRSISSDEIVHKKEGEYGSNLNEDITKKKKQNELENVLKLVACYDHPMPVSSVLLNTKGNIVYLCVLCGPSLKRDGTIFVYKTPISGEDIGSPSFVGYSPANFPSSKDAFGRMIPVDSSGIQFAPKAQSIVLLNSIKVVCCREGNIYCTCQECSSCCLEENAIKIVHVEVGFVSVVTKLKTTQAVRCILVCEPNYLVAADESGRLYLWVMDSSWSAQIDGCYLPVPEVMFSRIVELQKIPTCDALVVGHDGYGGFNLWDINRRVLMSKFSMSSTCITKCVPISSFQWQRDGRLCTELKAEEFASEVLNATKMRISGTRKNNIPETNEREDVAVWLLVSTIEDSHQPVDGQIFPVGCWRLALLIEETVIVGNSLDAMAAAVGVSDSHGIMGTKDGLVYLWELSTGTKVGMLHQFKGSGVSCIATDSCNDGTLAVASDSGQLRVYKKL